MEKVARCPSCGRLNRRSTQANARYWALLGTAAAKLKQGAFSMETLHIYYKMRFLGGVEHKLPNGRTVLMPYSTADLDTAGFNDYMTQVEADLNERGIFLEEMPA